MSSSVLTEVAAECGRQDAKWGQQDHSPERWFAILGEEFGEVAREVTKWIPPRDRAPDAANYRQELIQLAAVAVRMVECFDRQGDDGSAVPAESRRGRALARELMEEAQRNWRTPAR